MQLQTQQKQTMMPHARLQVEVLKWSSSSKLELWRQIAAGYVQWWKVLQDKHWSILAEGNNLKRYLVAWVKSAKTLCSSYLKLLRSHRVEGAAYNPISHSYSLPASSLVWLICFTSFIEVNQYLSAHSKLFLVVAESSGGWGVPLISVLPARCRK